MGILADAIAESTVRLPPFLRGLSRCVTDPANSSEAEFGSSPEAPEPLDKDAFAAPKKRCTCGLTKQWVRFETGKRPECLAKSTVPAGDFQETFEVAIAHSKQAIRIARSPFSFQSSNSGS